MESLISIIVPMLNRAHLIKRCLDSILVQRGVSVEIIIVDNGSTDSSVKVVEEWKNTYEKNENHIPVRLFIESKRGASSARNKGLMEAKGEYVMFLDSDDTLRAGALEKAKREIKEKKVDIVCWRPCIHLLDGRTKTPAVIKSDLLESHLIHTLLRPQCCIAKKEFIKLIGGWNEDLPGWNDWELGLRILTNNPKIVLLDEILTDIYSQEDSITGINFSSKEGIWEKSLDAAESYMTGSLFPLKKKVVDIINYRRVILASLYHKEGNKTGAKKLIKSLPSDISSFKHFVLLASFHYTKWGGRGAWRIVRKLM